MLVGPTAYYEHAYYEPYFYELYFIITMNE